VIEVNFRRFPREVEIGVGQAVILIVDQSNANEFAGRVDAGLETTSEQIDTHDTEDEPEHETDEQDVEYGGNRLN